MSFSVYEENLFNDNLTDYLFAEKKSKNEPLLRVKSSGFDLLNSLTSNNFQEYFNLIEYSEQAFKVKDGGNLQHGILFALKNLENSDFLCSTPLRLFTEETWNEISAQANLDRSVLISQLKNRMLENIIFPGLTSSNIVIRAKTCSFLGKMDQAIWVSEKQKIQLCQLVCNCLGEENEVSRITALKAIEYLVTLPECLPLLKGSLNVIIGKILEMLKLANLDDVVKSLHEIVKQYNDDIQKYAMEITNTLLTSFYESLEGLPIAETPDQECEYERDETKNTLETSLLTLNEILLLNLPQDFYFSSKVWVINLLTNIMSRPILYYLIDSGLKLFNSLLFNLPEYSEDIWFFFPPICYLLLEKEMPKDAQQFALTGFSQSQAELLTGGQFAKINANIPDYQRFLGNVYVSVCMVNDRYTSLHYQLEWL